MASNYNGRFFFSFLYFIFGSGDLIFARPAAYNNAARGFVISLKTPASYNYPLRTTPTPTKPDRDLKLNTLPDIQKDSAKDDFIRDKPIIIGSIPTPDKLSAAPISAPSHDPPKASSFSVVINTPFPNRVRRQDAGQITPAPDPANAESPSNSTSSTPQTVWTSMSWIMNWDDNLNAFVSVPMFVIMYAEPTSAPPAGTYPHMEPYMNPSVITMNLPAITPVPVNSLEDPLVPAEEGLDFVGGVGL
ncbi:hypothetical protein H072_10000 [Dactylellina haptotyla CBS 200.50]|uniref:Uncharacterized protein n=1 Tax=Dactylellina haptotyla (strain CBS 200.50) TaxID=1284197 RepID=S8A0H5_DACHA|nr:hypothetical protein H072_10000 [Dactylellina haptotyla CBS 200.50]